MPPRLRDIPITLHRGILRTPLRPRKHFASRPNTSADNTSNTSGASSSESTTSRFRRVHSRLPRFLQRFTEPIFSAPITHITSFLVLHEITAVVPLFALTGFFHYTRWLPPFFSEGKWISDGIEKFGRYGRRKGWLRDGDVETAGEIVENEAKEEKRSIWRGQRNIVEGKDGEPIVGKREKWFARGEGGVRLLVELGTAWAIIKVLMPARLVLSAWATPWFARRVVVPCTRGFKRIFKRSG